MNIDWWKEAAGLVVLVERPSEAQYHAEFMSECRKHRIDVGAMFYAVYMHMQHIVAQSIAAEWSENDESEFFAIYRALALANNLKSGMTLVRPQMRFGGGLDKFFNTVSDMVPSRRGIVVLGAKFDNKIHDVLANTPDDMKEGFHELMVRADCVIMSKDAVQQLFAWCESVSDGKEWPLSIYQKIGILSEGEALEANKSMSRSEDTPPVDAPVSRDMPGTSAERKGVLFRMFRGLW